jgi:hypothetical protein
MGSSTSTSPLIWSGTWVPVWLYLSGRGCGKSGPGWMYVGCNHCVSQRFECSATWNLFKLEGCVGASRSPCVQQPCQIIHVC